MVHVHKRVLLVFLLVPFLFLSISLFAVTLGLAVKGILEAENLNPCRSRNNVTFECTDDVPLSTSVEIDNPQPTSIIVMEPDELVWVYWLTGSTGCALLWCVVTTAGGWLLTKLIRKIEQRSLKKDEKEKKSGRRESEKELEEVELEIQHAESVTQSTEREETDHINLEIDIIGAYQVKEWYRQPLRTLNIPAVIALFFSLLTFMMATMCLLWAVAISYYHANRSDKDLIDFTLVEMLVGIVLPIFLFIGAALLSIVLNYVTLGREDLRKNMHSFLPSLTFLEAQNYDYWVIEERFYFRINKKFKHKSKGCLYSCDTSLSTWILAGIVSLTLLLSFSYFVDLSLVEVETRSSCPEEIGEYDCFNATSYTFIDCADDDQSGYVDQIHCFRFLQFGVDKSLISTISQAFVFYLLTSAFFAKIFSVVKLLEHIKPSRYWGVGFILLGALAFIGAIVFLAVEDTFKVQIDLVAILRAMMIFLFLILVGLLLLLGKWGERVFLDHKNKPLPIAIANFDNTTARELREVEHEYAAQLKEKDPNLEHQLEMHKTSSI